MEDFELVGGGGGGGSRMISNMRKHAHTWISVYTY